MANKYEKLAPTPDEREARNRAIEKGLGEGAGNVENEGEKVAIVEEWTEEVTTARGTKKTLNRRKVIGFDQRPVEIVVPLMPTNNRGGETRAQKRARLKAASKKLVKNVKHPTGACGNVGCKRCNPCPANFRKPANRSEAEHRQMIARRFPGSPHRDR